MTIIAPVEVSKAYVSVLTDMGYNPKVTNSHKASEIRYDADGSHKRDELDVKVVCHYASLDSDARKDRKKLKELVAELDLHKSRILVLEEREHQLELEKTQLATQLGLLNDKLEDAATGIKKLVDELTTHKDAFRRAWAVLEPKVGKKWQAIKDALTI